MAAGKNTYLSLGSSALPFEWLTNFVCAAGSNGLNVALKKLIDERGKDAFYSIAALLALRDEANRAFEWLDKAAANKDSELVAVFQDPLFQKIRRAPRWLPFLRKLGRAAEQLTAVDLKVTLPK